MIFPHYDFSDTVLLVTGAGRGIGFAIARDFARFGATVYLNDVLSERASHATAELIKQGYDAFAAPGDVSAPGQVVRVVDHVVARHGRIDVLVNNAGVEPVSSIFDHSLEDWQYALDTNLTGAFLCSQQAALQMRAQGRGVIINIASIAGKSQPLYLRSAYAASKAGLVGFTKEAAREFAPFGIRVNAIAPGVINTPMTAHLRDDPQQMARWRTEIPLGRLGQPQEVSALCLWLASDAASYVTGVAWHVDGGKNMA